MKRKLAELSRQIGSGGERQETLPMSTPPHSVGGDTSGMVQSDGDTGGEGSSPSHGVHGTGTRGVPATESTEAISSARLRVTMPATGIYSTPPPRMTLPELDPAADGLSASGRSRRGKATLIEFFSSEDPAILLDDWEPRLKRAAQWNGWTTQDKLIQLPGYLKGRALQEWHLLTSEEQQSYPVAINALCTRLDPRNKTMAAQEFRHSLQRPDEGVAEFIRLIEKSYHIAHGKDAMSCDTRDALLYGQLYEGLQ